VSLPVTIGGGTTVHLDKYNITAGRYRKFVEYLTALNGGNMRAWLTANMPDDWPTDWEKLLPIMLDNGKDYLNDGDHRPEQQARDDHFTGIYQELGADLHHFDSAFAGDINSGNSGCYIGGYGARTYKLPDGVNARLWGNTGDMQRYPQEDLDERSLNCVTAPMLAAFCVWDGGRLAKPNEISAAWGPNYYPWGNQRPAGYCTTHRNDPGDGNGCYSNYLGTNGYGEILENPSPIPLENFFYANYNANYWGNLSLIGADYSLYIAPPGRFPQGNSPTGHADLGGNVINATYESGGRLDDYGLRYVLWSNSGSWQGHPVGPANGGVGYDRPARYKYWAMGGRCTH
jgi:hypothetical protein